MRNKSLLVVLLLVFLVPLVSAANYYTDIKEYLPSNYATYCPKGTVGVVGASNTVSLPAARSYVDVLKEICPSTNFVIGAVAGWGPKYQYQGYSGNKGTVGDSVFVPVLNQNLEILILSPSGNLVSDSSSHRDYVVKMADDAKTNNPDMKVVVLDVSPRKVNIDFVKDFNLNLLSIKLGSDNIDQAVDIYSVLNDPNDDGTCAFCSSDGLHWTKVGDERVALKIFYDVFIGQSGDLNLPTGDGKSNNVISKGSPSTASSSTTTTGTTTTKRVDKIVADCQSTQTCKEIDEVWSTRVSLALGGNGKVWDTTLNNWNLFDNVYYEIVQVTTGGTVVPGGVGTTGGITGVAAQNFMCLNADLDKLDQSIFAGCDRFRSSYEKYMAENGLSGNDMLLRLYAISYQESRCRTGSEMVSDGISQSRANRGIMQVDSCDNDGTKCYDDTDYAIKKGIQNIKSVLDSVGTSLSAGDAFKLVAFGYNRGSGTMNKATTYVNNGESLSDAMLKACKDVYPLSSVSGVCGPGGDTDRCCEIGVEYGDLVETHFNNACSQISPSVSAIFPLEQGSLDLIKYDWGNSRDGGGRCHAGIDIETKSPGRVVAVADGEVVAVMPAGTTCSKGWAITSGNTENVYAVLVYHPSLGATINYGEIDNGHLGSNIKVGNQIKQGEYIGRAGYCDLMHFELYSGKVTVTEQWKPPIGETSSGILNKCASQFLNTKPSSLLDPTSFLQQLENKYTTTTSSSASTSSATSTSAGTKLIEYVSSCSLASTSTADKNNLIVIPTSALVNSNVYFYFRGLRPSTADQSLTDYVQSSTNNFLSAVEGSNQNSVFVLFKEPQNHYNGGGNPAWIGDNFDCFVNEALEKLSDQGIASVDTLNLAAHSGGGKAVSEVLSKNSGFSFSNILLFDACYSDWCKVSANKLSSGNVMSVYFNELNSADFDNADAGKNEDKNSMILRTDLQNDPKLKFIDVKKTAHNSMVGSCLFYHQGIEGTCITN